MSGPDDLKDAIEGAKVVQLPVKGDRQRKQGGGGGKGSGPPGDGSGEGPGGQRREPAYSHTNKGTWWLRLTSHGELAGMYELEARIGDGPISRFAVSHADFSNLGWMDRELGSGAFLVPGKNFRDHFCHGTRMLSIERHGGGAPKRWLRTCTGWMEHNGEQLYCDAAGAIGASCRVADLETELPAREAFQCYRLPDPGEGEALALAVRAVLRLLDLAPVEIVAPLLAAVFRAVLGHAPFTIWIEGASGVFKSQVAALLQTFWGARFNSERLPMNWETTRNDNENSAFILKDTMYVADDYAPNGRRHAEDLQRDADRLIRNQGNGAARNRLSSDGTAKASRPPRGLLLVTGETVPDGQSIRARLLIVTIRKGNVDPERLTAAQADAAAGLYAAAQAAFIRYLAGDLAGARAQLAALSAELAGGLPGGAHARTPRILGELGAAARLFFDFAVAAGVLPTREADALWLRMWAAMGELVIRQADYQREEDVCGQFLALLGAAIRAGQVHLSSVAAPVGPPEGNEAACGHQSMVVGTDRRWLPKGDLVGWTDGELAFLLPESAYAAAQGLATSQGRGLPISPKMLWRRMAEAGKLARSDKEQSTYRKRIGAQNVRTLVLRLADLIGERDAGGDPEPDVPAPDPSVPSNRSLQDLSGTHQAVDGAEENSPVPEVPASPDTHTLQRARELIGDVLAVMGERGIDKVPAEALAAELARRPPRPWWSGDKAITPKRLSRLLATIGLPTVQLGGAASNLRGYRRGAVEEVRDRLVASAQGQATTASVLPVETWEEEL